MSDVSAIGPDAAAVVERLKEWRDHAMKLGRPCICTRCEDMDEDLRESVKEIAHRADTSLPCCSGMKTMGNIHITGCHVSAMRRTEAFRALMESTETPSPPEA